MRWYRPGSPSVVSVGRAKPLMLCGEGDCQEYVTATEFRLLSVLARRPGQAFTREMLLDLVWGVRVPGRLGTGERGRPAAPSESLL
jgi:hypothetical protein